MCEDRIEGLLSRCSYEGYAKFSLPAVGGDGEDVIGAQASQYSSKHPCRWLDESWNSSTK